MIRTTGSPREPKDTEVMYGLPKIMKFPLFDKEDVLHAIRLFEYCPPTNRNELATNINKKIKEYDMKIPVSREMLFYKFMNKEYLQESAIIDDVQPIATEEDIKNIEKEAIKEITTIMNTAYSDNSMTRIVELNEDIYKTYLPYLEYEEYEGRTDADPLFYRFISDATTVIIDYAEKGDYETANKVVNTFCKIMTDVDYNPCYMLCHLYSIEYYLNRKNYQDNTPQYNGLVTNIRSLSSTAFKKYTDGKYPINVNKSHNLIVAIISSEIVDKCKKTSAYFSDVYTNSTDCGSSFRGIGDPTRVRYCSSEYVQDITNYFNPDKLKCIGKYNLTTKLTDIEIFKCSRVKEYIEYLCMTIDKYGDRLVCAKKGDKIYVVLSDEDRNLFLLEMTSDAINYFTSNAKYKDTFNIVKISFERSKFHELKSLTEGITLDEDGNIKISLSSKKSYMDKYSQNHKLLVENWKNKNYEGVKKNLAFVFALINIIERDKKYKERDPELVKARSFAINDFKTYMKKISEVEKDFDFVEYYDKSEYDKLIVDVPKQTLLGIKSLVRDLLK